MGTKKPPTRKQKMEKLLVEIAALNAENLDICKELVAVTKKHTAKCRQIHDKYGELLNLIEEGE